MRRGRGEAVWCGKWMGNDGVTRAIPEGPGLSRHQAQERSVGRECDRWKKAGHPARSCREAGCEGTTSGKPCPVPEGPDGSCREAGCEGTTRSQDRAGRLRFTMDGRVKTGENQLPRKNRCHGVRVSRARLVLSDTASSRYSFASDIASPPPCTPRSPELPVFFAIMGALTPGRPALRILIRGNELRLVCRPGLPVFRHRTFRLFRLQPPPVVPTYF